MSKVVIVTDIEIPNRCVECGFFNSTYSLYCYLTKNNITNVYDKPGWCPVRLLPEEEYDDCSNDYYDDYYRGHTNGWNDCLKEIIGEND